MERLSIFSTGMAPSQIQTTGAFDSRVPSLLICDVRGPGCLSAKWVGILSYFIVILGRGGRAFSFFPRTTLKNIESCQAANAHQVETDTPSWFATPNYARPLPPNFLGGLL